LSSRSINGLAYLLNEAVNITISKYFETSYRNSSTPGLFKTNTLQHFPSNSKGRMISAFAMGLNDE
jgi:hypothetical protein